MAKSWQNWDLGLFLRSISFFSPYPLSFILEEPSFDPCYPIRAYREKNWWVECLQFSRPRRTPSLSLNCFAFSKTSKPLYLNGPAYHKRSQNKSGFNFVKLCRDLIEIRPQSYKNPCFFCNCTIISYRNLQ